MTVSSRSDSPTVPVTAATQDTIKMASTEEAAEGPVASVSEGTNSPSSDTTDQHDERTTKDHTASPDQKVSRDSEHLDSGDEDSSEDDGDECDDGGKVSSSDESPTSVAVGIPGGDSNADLHALLAISKRRLDTVKPVAMPDESSSQDDTTQTESDTNTKTNYDAQDEAEKEEQEEKKEEEDEDGNEEKETDDVAAETAQDVPAETMAAAPEAKLTNPADDKDGSNATADSASEAKTDDEVAAAGKADGMSSKEAAAKASLAGDVSNQELWALLSYSKQRLETGAHAGQKKDKKKKSVGASSRKKRSSSMGTSGSTKSPSDAEDNNVIEELRLDGGDDETVQKEGGVGTSDVGDNDGQHSRETGESVVSDADGSDGEKMDSDEEEYTDKEKLSSDEEDSEDSDDDSAGGIPATPVFLRQLAETDKEGPDSTDAKIMSDAARSYADAILSVADEKTTGDLTDEQILEAMYVAEAAAAAGEERFTTSIAKLRLHEAKEASKKMAASMKVEVEKAAKTAKAAQERQIARQNKFFSGKRPAGQWIKGKMKEFQDTCAKVDGGQP
jgi:hypothetical protein